MTRRVDAVILGAGPSGSTAARVLARRGHSVVLVDRLKPGRDKTCGDALIPDALAELDRAGLSEVVRPRACVLKGVRFLGPSGGEIRVPLSVWTIARRVLDAALVEAATAAGAEVMAPAALAAFDGRGKEARLELDLGATGARETLRSDVVIACVGANVDALSNLGVLTRRSPSALAARAYARRTTPRNELDDWLHIWFDRSLLPGYAWAFPMEGHRYNLGVGSFLRDGKATLNLRHLFATFIAGPGKRLMDGLELETPLRGAPLRTDLAGAVPRAPRLLVAGEAVGATLALSGEGIGKAMTTGRLAAESACRAFTPLGFDESRLDAYPPLLAELSTIYDPYRAAQRWLEWPQVADFLIARVGRRPRLLTLLQDILAERVPASALVSPLGLIRALLP